MERNCEINKEEIESSLDSTKGIIEYLSQLLILMHKIFSGELLVELVKEKFDL